LIETLEWLRKRPDVKARRFTVEIPEALRDWIARETKLGNPALEAEAAKTRDPELEHALRWSKAVNESITAMVRGVPPFPFVRESIEKLGGHADVLVVSATPQEALCREWEEHDLAKHVAAICGQEIGTKKQTLEVARQYEPNHALMIGDAPGDHRAAVANNVLFFPINPGGEEASWERLFEEGIDRFLGDTFAGDYQQQLLDEFESYLPEKPPWPVEETGGGCRCCST
ncbi:MAG: HAD family hydrolase, partial [Pirellulaceae bacterium]|nr:HAD family hydrolase [Pirellulaceae bacterium]